MFKKQKLGLITFLLDSYTKKKWYNSRVMKSTDDEGQFGVLLIGVYPNTKVTNFEISCVALE